MGRKEKYQKELDFILEKLRFWRYVILAIFSGIVGIGFSMTQHKIEINVLTFLFLLFGFVGILISVFRINALTKRYYFYLDLLEKEE